MSDERPELGWVAYVRWYEWLSAVAYVVVGAWGISLLLDGGALTPSRLFISWTLFLLAIYCSVAIYRLAETRWTRSRSRPDEL